MPEPITVAIVGGGGAAVILGLAKRQFGVFKELMDLVGGCLATILFMPVMLFCAVIVKFSDPGGPILYRQVRVGLNGRLFTIYKFRSMYMDAEKHGQAIKAGAEDPRVIPGCRWMRMSHIDEIPQLFNILRGEMSLVGPRPERPELFEALSREVPDFERRLAVKPGLTGMAQIYNGYDTDSDSVKRKLAMDLEYIEKMSLGLELKLLAATLTKFRDQGAR